MYQRIFRIFLNSHWGSVANNLLYNSFVPYLGRHLRSLYIIPLPTGHSPIVWRLQLKINIVISISTFILHCAFVCLGGFLVVVGFYRVRHIDFSDASLCSYLSNGHRPSAFCHTLLLQTILRGRHRTIFSVLRHSTAWSASLLRLRRM